MPRFWVRTPAPEPQTASPEAAPSSRLRSGPMELDARVAGRYLEDAFAHLLAVAGRLGDERINRRPHGPTTNTGAALVVHCCGLTRWWLGHLALGEPTDRDRASELDAEATVAELAALVEATVARALDHLRRLDAGEGVPVADRRCDLPAGASDASVVLHVLEELYQHLGHLELTADALGALPT